MKIVAERFGIDKTSVIPAAAGTKPLSKADGPQTEAEIEEMRGVPYREAVGALIWVATMTRPDLAYAAHTLARRVGDARWRRHQLVFASTEGNRGCDLQIGIRDAGGGGE